MRKERFAWLICLVLLGAAGCRAQAVDGYRVLQAYPHDSRAFTQGNRSSTSAAGRAR